MAAAARRLITAALLLTTCLANALGSCDAKKADRVAKRRWFQWHQHQSTTQGELVWRSLLHQDTVAAPAASSAAAAGPPLQLPENALEVSNNILDEQTRRYLQLCSSILLHCQCTRQLALHVCPRMRASGGHACMLTTLPIAMRRVFTRFSRWLDSANANVATCRSQTCTLNKQKDATRCKAVKKVYYEQKDAGAAHLFQPALIPAGRAPGRLSYLSNHAK